MSEFTLILLPGMLGTENLFRPLLDILPPGQKQRVIAYPPNQVLSNAQLLQLIEAELGDERDLVLLGESFAGPLALEFAVAHPERVVAVIFSASFVSPPLPAWLRWFVRPALFRLPIPSFLIRFVSAGANASALLVEEIKLALRTPKAEVLARRAIEALTLDSTRALRLCQVPILYLAPDQDRLVLNFNLSRILAMRSDVQVCRINGPHLILQTQPMIAWKAIQEFVFRVAK